MSRRVLALGPQTSDFAALVSELSGAGYVVTSEHDAAAGLAQLQVVDFDAVLCDVDGDDAALLRSARGICPHTEVIAVSRNADRALALTCLQAGAVNLLEMPTAAGELLLSVSRAIECRSLRTTSRLAAATQVIFAATDQEALPRNIVDTARDVMGADDVSLMLADSDGALVLVHSNASSPMVAPRGRVAIGERIAGRVAAQGEPLILTNPDAVGSSETRVVYSSIVYPLIAGGRRLGVLNLNRVATKRPFRDADLVPAGVLAAHCVLALENARLTREFIAAERLAGVGELAAGIAHEINNPMVALLAALTDVRETLGALRRFGELVESQATGATLRASWAEFGGTACVADMQAALREGEAGAFRIRTVTAEVRALAGHDEAFQRPFRAQDTIRSAMRVAGVHLRHRVHVEEDRVEDDTWVWGSAGAVAQAVCSLLVAGAQAVDEEISDASIAVAVRRDGDQVVIHVQHPWHIAGVNVPGMWRSEAVGQGPQARALWVAGEVCRRHGGELQVTQGDGGTCFALVLPHLTVGAPTVEERAVGGACG